MKSSSELDFLIPPEIKEDAFFEALERLASREDVHSVLEVGASSGEGSTRAFAAAIERKRQRNLDTSCRLFCLEISAPRYEKLKKDYESFSYVTAYRASSIGVSDLMQPSEVRAFYESTPTQLNHYPLERVLGWLEQDKEYLLSQNIPQDGIQQIKKDFQIVHFDLVLIDGSAFSAAAELEAVYGAKIICLDDINDIKNFNNYHRLLKDDAYVLTEVNQTLRNGYAIFEHS